MESANDLTYNPTTPLSAWPFGALRMSTKPPPPMITTLDVLTMIRGRSTRIQEERSKREETVVKDRLSKCDGKYMPLLKLLEPTITSASTLSTSNATTLSSSTSEHCCVLSLPSSLTGVFQFSHDVVINGILIPNIVTRGGEGVPSSVLRQLLKLAEIEMDKKKKHVHNNNKGSSTAAAAATTTAPLPQPPVGSSFRERHINQLWRLMPTTARDVVIPFTDLLPPLPVLHTTTPTREAGRKSGRQGGDDVTCGSTKISTSSRRAQRGMNKHHGKKDVRATDQASSQQATSVRLAEQDVAVPLDVLCGMNRRALPGLIYHDLCFQLLSDLGLRHMALGEEDSEVLTNLFADSAASLIRDEMADLHVKCAPQKAIADPSNHTTISMVDAVTQPVPSSESLGSCSNTLLTVRVEGGGVCLPLPGEMCLGAVGEEAHQSSLACSFHMPRLVSVSRLPTADGTDAGTIVVCFGEGALAKRLAVHFTSFARRILCQHTSPPLQTRYCTYNNTACINNLAGGSNVKSGRHTEKNDDTKTSTQVYQCDGRQFTHQCSSSKSSSPDVGKEVQRLMEQARRHVHNGRYKTVRADSPSRDWLNER